MYSRNGMFTEIAIEIDRIQPSRDPLITASPSRRDVSADAQRLEVGSSSDIPLQLDRGDQVKSRTAEKSSSQIECSQGAAWDDQAAWIVSAGNGLLREHARVRCP